MADRAPRLILHAAADAELLRELRASRPGRRTRGADDVFTGDRVDRRRDQGVRIGAPICKGTEVRSTA